MTDFKGLIFIVVIMTMTILMGSSFYTSFMSATDVNRPVPNLAFFNKTSEINAIVSQSVNLTSINTPTDFTIIFSVIGIFLSAGYSIIKLTLSVPSIFFGSNGLIPNMQQVLPFAIPAEFVTIVYIVLVLTITFGIAKFIAGR